MGRNSKEEEMFIELDNVDRSIGEDCKRDIALTRRQPITS